MRSILRPAPAARGGRFRRFRGTAAFGRAAAAFLLLSLAPSGTAWAADTLYCGGGDVEIFIEAGSEGISDVLLGVGDETRYLDPADLAYSCIDWNLKELHVELRDGGGTARRVKLRASGTRGTFTRDGKRYRVRCDWEK